MARQNGGVPWAVAVFIAVLMVGLAAPTFGDPATGGEKIFVSSLNGNDSLGCGNRITPCQSLGFAFQQLSINTTTSVVVLPGVYTGQSNMQIKSSSLVWDLISSDGYESTIVDCAGNPTDYRNVVFFSEHSQVYTNFSISGLTFRNCASVIDFEGALSAIITNCYFTNIGLTPLLPSGGSVATIANCTFVGNGISDDYQTSTTSGGAISIGADAVVTIRGCLFLNNRALLTGGAIAIQSAYAVIDHCRFENNHVPFTANSDRDLLATSGGAISVYRVFTPVIIMNSQFVNNSALNGGVLVTIWLAGVDVRNCTFDGNSALSDGSILFSVSVSTVKCTPATCWITFTDSVFRNNSGATSGAIYIPDSWVVTLTRVHAIGNRVLSGPTAAGAVVRMIAVANGVSGVNLLTVTDSRFIENQAIDFGSGGVFAVSGTAAVNITDCWFHRNSVNQDLSVDGGAVLLVGDGGASIVTVTRCEFIGNSGGAINIFGTHSLQTYDSKFFGNTAAGSAVLKTSYHARVGMTRCQFIRNSASLNNGGVAFVHAATLSLVQCNCTENQGSSGGCLYGDQPSAISISESVFSRNFVSGSGGALYTRDPLSLTVRSTLFDSNSAVLTGGAIAFESSQSPLDSQFAPIFTGGVTLTENNAFLNGGGIYFVNAVSCPPSDQSIAVTYIDNTVVFHGREAISNASSSPAKIVLQPLNSNTFVPGIATTLTWSVVDCFDRPMANVESSIPVRIAATPTNCMPDPIFSFLVEGAVTANVVLSASLTDLERSCIVTIAPTQSSQLIVPPPLTLSPVPCPPGTYQYVMVDASLVACSECDSNQYQLRPNQPLCFDCPQHTTCTDGAVLSAESGFWLGTSDTKTGEVQAFRCLPGYCLDNNTCAENHRMPVASNPLCGECEVGFVEILGRCAACAEVRAGFIVLSLVVFWVLIVIVHALVQTSPGPMGE